MKEPSSDDWLPPGWKVEMKLTSTGRKYKCYIHPSRGLKFYSKPEVSRYLNKAPLNDRESIQKKSIERKTPIKTMAPAGKKKSMEKKKHCIAKKVVFERVTAEGLPPGWIKEIKIQKKCGTVRRDAYYTDPVNGYIFRSMKDTLRYLKTGDPGRLAFKPKPRDSGDINLEDDKTYSPVVPRKQELAGGGARRQITRGQSLKLGKIASDEGIPKPACSGAKVTESSLYLSEAKGSEPIGEKSDDAKNVLDSAPLVEPLAEKQPLENRAKVCGKRKTQPGLCNYRNKKSHDLPRRASKRLAGLEADVTPELKTTNRGSRVAAGHSGEIEAGIAEAEPKTKCSFQPSQKLEVLLESNSGKTPVEDLVPPEEQAEKVEAENKDKEKHGCSLSLPLGDGPIPIEHAGVAEDENKGAGNPEPPHELPFGDSWTDPCIEFAIKTLTSDHLFIEDYFQQQLSSPHAQTNNGSNFGLGNLQQTDFPFQQYDVAENPAPELQAPVQPTFLKDGNVNFPSSGETGGYQPGEDKSKASLKAPAQIDNGLNLGLGNFHQTDFSFQHNVMAQNPAPKPQAPVQPIFQQAGNARFLSSGQTGLRQPGEDKSKELQGPTIQPEGNASFPSSGATGGLHQRGEDKSKEYQKQLIY